MLAWGNKREREKNTINVRWKRIKETVEANRNCFEGIQNVNNRNCNRKNNG